MKCLLQRLGLVILLLTLFGCTQSPEETGERQIRLTLAETQVAGHPITRSMLYFADEVYTETEGRVSIKVSAAGEEGTENSSIARVRNGELDLARVSSVSMTEYSSNYIPLTLPYIFNSREHMWAFARSEAGRDILENTEGCEALSWVENGARCFYSDAPIYSPQDMEGKTFRIPISDVMSELLRAYGAKVTTVDLSAVYNSVNEGRIDGAENDIISYDYFANDVVAPYYTLNCHSYAPSLIIASSSLKDKLGEEDYNILCECALKAEERSVELWDETEAEVLSSLEERGVTVIEPNEEQMRLFKEYASGIYEDYPEYKDIIDQIRAIEP